MLLGLAFVCGGVGTAAGGHVGVRAAKLLVIDKTRTVGRAKVVFIAKDPAVAKGAGADVDGVSVSLRVRYPGAVASGVFSVPFGSLLGWVANEPGVAKYVNPAAPDGPTDVMIAVLKPGRVLRLVGKGLGSPALDVRGAGPPDGPVSTAYCVTNAGETTCHCSTFSVCSWRAVAAGAGAKLLCTAGSPDAACVAVPTTTTSSTPAGVASRPQGP